LARGQHIAFVAHAVLSMSRFVFTRDHNLPMEEIRSRALGGGR
jgi:hypothetical protein